MAKDETSGTAEEAADKAEDLLTEIGKKHQELMVLYRRKRKGTGPITTIMRSLEKPAARENAPAAAGLSEPAANDLTPDELDRLAEIEKAQAAAHEQRAELYAKISRRKRKAAGA